MKNIKYSGQTYLDIQNGVYFDNVNCAVFVVTKRELKTFIDLSKRVGDDYAISALPVYHVISENFESSSKVALRGRPIEEISFIGEF